MKTLQVTYGGMPMGAIEIDEIAESEKVSGFTGMTQGETYVMDRLLEAHKMFNQLPRQHSDEMREFVDALHRMQDLLAVRVVRRTYPRGWPVKE